MANLNLNKVILGGKLTADPEIKTTPSGTPVTQFSVAVNRRSKDNEQQADFINCVAWKNTAEFITKYFRKGSSICVTGRIQTRSWKDQNGQNRYATEVIVEEAMFVDSKNEVAAPQTPPQSAPQMDYNQTAPQTGYNLTASPQMEDLGDDDLPF
jgi:single-strand DNA-binding protein